MNKLLSLAFAATALLLAGPAWADDWTATKLRGTVLVGDDAATSWTRVARGDAVADNHVVRTLSSGNAEFQRGNETVAFGPNTQAEIVDRTGKRPYTTVVQQFGQVAISADVRQVQHFAVSTPFLVAVVKGTEFTVTTGPRGSTVVVSRGLVAVTGIADHHTVNVAAGQTVSAATNGALVVAGTPNAALTHPVVNGVVEDDDTAATEGNPATPETGLGGTVTRLGATVGDTVTTVGGTVGGIAGNVGTTVGNTVGTIGSTVGGTVGGTLGNTITSTTTTVGNTVSGTTSTIGNTVTSVTTTVGTTVGTVGGTVGGTLHRLGL